MKRAIALLIILVSGLGWLLGWSPYLRVETIDVTGIGAQSPLTEQLVISTSEVQIGMPLARVSEPSIRRALLRIPRVGSVDVIRSWPHSIEIRVKERSPWAVVRTPNALYFVDDQGVFFPKIGSSTETIPIVDMAVRSQPLIQDVIHVVGQLPQSLHNRVIGMSALSADLLTLRISAGSSTMTVIWGSADESALKSRVLNGLLAKDKSAQWSQIDLSAPRAPTTRK